MATGYGFAARTRLEIGPATTVALAELTKGARVGVISSKSVYSLAATQELVSWLQNSATSVATLGFASPNPRVAEAEAALHAARETQVDVLLGIGGGSVMDCAKAVRLALASGASVSDMFDSGSYRSDRSISLAVVPTAFGTGAEVSAGAILTQSETETAKSAIRHRLLPPDLAIIDTTFAKSLGRSRLVEIGFDALAHAIETFLSRRASPITDILAREALRRLPGTLVHLVGDTAVDPHLEELAVLSALMGYNLANASTCLPHRLQYAIAAVKESSHQRDLLAVYPAWLNALELARVPRLDEAMAGIRAAVAASDVHVGSTSVSDLFRGFRELIGIEPTLSELGLESSDLPRLVGGVTGTVHLDPLQPTAQDIESILLAALQEAS